MAATASTGLLPGGSDTIAALATAPGRGAVALVRISGARAMEIARALGAFSTLNIAEGKPENGLDVEPRVAYRALLREPGGNVELDDVLVTWFKGPSSYTGEDVVEISTHGGVIAPMRVLAACVSLGARPALPGEFTKRAVLNGRMDLLQAEAVGDIVDARTTALQQQALVQLDGGLRRRLEALREQVIHLEALIAYDIDFPEEDDGPIAPERVDRASEELLKAIRSLLATVPQGSAMRDGVLVVLAGEPNAGKSSLFNALLGESRAIVTSVPGTTRDAIEALLDRSPYPLRLVDTAGLRDTQDEVERLGIEVSSRYLGNARVVLACGDCTNSLLHTLSVVKVHSSATVIPVLTKSDLSDGVKPSVVVPDIGRTDEVDGVVKVSAEYGVGLKELLEAIDDAACESSGAPTAGDNVVITRERHRAGLSTALAELEEFARVWSTGELPAMVAGVHLIAAREALGELIGTVDTEEILDRVFRDFCVGK